MDQFVSQPVPLERHPISKKKYIIPTPSIDAFFLRVKKCIRLRIPGAIIYSLPRYGKSYAIKYIRLCLIDEYPKLPVYSFICHKKKTSSEAAFFSNLLKSVGHAHPSSGTASAKRERLTNYLCEKADSADQDLIVFFADEAQKLDIAEYEWIRDVHDELERHGIRMITFLVGQHQLLQQKHALRESKQSQIVMRFMVNELQFRGILTLEDLATCLQGYDESVFPEKTEWSYTRFFFPKAHANGFRMLHQAPKLWNAFQKAYEKASFGRNMEIPMQYVAHTIELFLLENMEHDSGKFRGSQALWTQAIADSHYIDAQENLRIIFED